MQKKLLFIFSFLLLGVLTYTLVTSQTIIPPTSAGYVDSANVYYGNTTSCNPFLRDLRIGMRSYEVEALQTKLMELGYFNHVPTGYFGFITFNAVRAYQRDNGIISTGYFGPLTRGAINNKICYTPPTPPIVIDPSPNEPPYNCKVWYDGCNTCMRSAPGGELGCTEMMCIQGGDEAWFIAHKPRCMEYFDNNIPVVNPKPVIHSLSGPTSLKVGEVGKWSISSSIADNSSLTYEITWGDENNYPYYGLKVSSQTYSQNTSFEHTYNSPGVYTITIKVRSVNGQVTETTQTVNVENQVSAEAPYNCKSWFDGCNSCGRSTPGGPMFCTLMYCPINAGTPYCSEYFY